MKNKTQYSFISLGCARTLVDSESMMNELKKIGFEWTAEGSNEQVTILNTCSFIQDAIDETEANIDHLLEQKNAGEVKHVAVVGCYPSRYKKKDLIAKYPAVDLWLTTKESHLLGSKLQELVAVKKFQPIDNKPYIKLTPSHYSYLKISEGCDNWCTFCTIPKIRGTHTSKPLEQILTDAELALSQGSKELLLIAEDTTAWGEDIYGTPCFEKVLEALAQTKAKWIRPMYIFPARVTDALIDIMAKHDNITNYIDMPIQHVSNAILEGMNRRHDKAHLETILQKFMDKLPGFALRSTFLIGFPGETEADIDELIQFIEAYPFAHIGCFKYSEERETRSAKYDNKVADAVIEKRIKRVMKRQLELVQERNKKRLGETIDVLYEGNGIARSYKECPEVDGVIHIENPEKMIPGRFYTATLTGVQQYDLIAKNSD